MTNLRVLLLGNHGVEMTPIVPDAEDLQAHLGQACAPLECWCGAVHGVGEEADLTIHLGPTPPDHAHGKGVMVAFAPEEVVRDYAVIVPDHAASFGPAAVAFVEQLVGCLMRPGLIGLDFEDVRSFLLDARRLRFHRGIGLAPAPRMTSGFMYVVGPPTLSLFTVSELADHYTAGCMGVVLFASMIYEAHAGEPRTSMIYGPAALL